MGFLSMTCRGCHALDKQSMGNQ